MFISLGLHENWITSSLVIGSGIVAWLRGRNAKQQLQSIQFNVDGNLSTALKEIDELKREVLRMKDETVENRKTTAILTELLSAKKNGKHPPELEP